jgi:BirA family biotin operon repressor/biotin-[acetyl-CoA-carboxylase] ligase
MESLPIANPFPDARSFLVRETSSTQDEARRLSRLGFPSGSVVAAEFQGAGRGRFPERRWEAETGKNLLFTIRLDPAYALLPALPLRVGAALCRSTDILALRMGIDRGKDRRGEVRLKWPNDLLIGGRKASGILCESGPEGVFVGVGVNCNQTSFPGDLGKGATSLAIEFGVPVDRWAVLELFLGALKIELGETDWRSGVEALLWKRGEHVRFIPGLPGAGEAVEGSLAGIDPSGALLILPEGGTAPISFAAGELRSPRDRGGAS